MRSWACLLGDTGQKNGGNIQELESLEFVVKADVCEPDAAKLLVWTTGAMRLENQLHRGCQCFEIPLTLQ